MSSEVAPRDDREIGLELVLGSESILGKLGFSFKRSWEHRGHRYLQSVADAADVAPEVVNSQIATGGPFADVFYEGMRLAISKGEESWRNTWARFVATALQDQTRIDEVSFLMNELGHLSPAHIRVFWRIYRATNEIQEGADAHRILEILCDEYQMPSVMATSLVHGLELSKLFSVKGATGLNPNRGYNYAGSSYVGTTVFMATPLAELAVSVAGGIDDSLISPSWQPPL